MQLPLRNPSEKIWARKTAKSTNITPCLQIRLPWCTKRRIGKHKVKGFSTFVPVKDKIQSTTYRIYDGACGTGGMLTVAEGRIQEVAKEFGRNVKPDG